VDSHPILFGFPVRYGYYLYFFILYLSLWIPCQLQKPKSNFRRTPSASDKLLASGPTVPLQKGPVRQALMLASSFFRFRLSVLTSSLHPMQQRGRQQVISTLPVLQSISGLCSLSQVIPRIRFCLPKPVTANNARSECFSYRMMSSTTSDMQPASFGVPSTLKTGITRKSFFV
jgi:hypothetical protein